VPAPVPGEAPVLGIPAGAYLARAGAAAAASFERQVKRLLAAGFPVRRSAFLADIDEVAVTHLAINRFELARAHAAWFAAHGERYRPETAAAIREGQEIDERVHAGALRALAAFRERLPAVMADEGVDLWLAPAATGPAPLGLGSTGDAVMSLPWTFGGGPVLTLPVDRTPDGLPLGLQCAGRPGGDEELFAHAAVVAGHLLAPEPGDAPTGR
jgi:Asp-tRNA(Asn)/Glu-tRNA(Gln) amidotransferase A subunit family amidase